MIRKIILLSSVIVLGACSYFIDDSIQDVRIETPGAEGAKCYVYVDGLKYVANPPQKINIFKSKEPIEIDCMAPGNRRKQIFIEPGTQESTYLNAGNLGAGAPLDYASGAMFRYPDVIRVDFTGMKAQDFQLPAYENPDVRAPETYKLEEFSPGTPRLNSDAGVPKPVLLRRGESYPPESKSSNDPSVFSEPAVRRSDKGDLKKAVEAPAPKPSAPLTNSEADSNSAGEAQKSPTPLFPGQ